GVLEELPLDLVFGVVSGRRGLPALDGDEGDFVARLAEDLPGVRGFRNVVAGGLSGVAEAAVAGEREQHTLRKVRHLFPFPRPQRTSAVLRPPDDKHPLPRRANRYLKGGG